MQSLRKIDGFIQNKKTNSARSVGVFFEKHAIHILIRAGVSSFWTNLCHPLPKSVRNRAHNRGIKRAQHPGAVCNPAQNFECAPVHKIAGHKTKQKLARRAVISTLIFSRASRLRPSDYFQLGGTLKGCSTTKAPIYNCEDSTA